MLAKDVMTTQVVTVASWSGTASKPRSRSRTSSGARRARHPAAGYNAIAIPVAAGVLSKMGILLTPAAGAVLMSLSTVIVAVNARLRRLERSSAS
jgi:cation transport ATPase